MTTRRTSDENTQTKATNRPKRTPIARSRDILTTKGIPDGYVGRWVNDDPSGKDPDRVPRFLEAGYEFVTDKGVVIGDRTVDTADSVSSLKTRNVGHGVTAYLMVILKEYYDEDLAYKAEQIDKREADLFKELQTGDGRYVKELNIK